MVLIISGHFCKLYANNKVGSDMGLQCLTKCHFGKREAAMD